MSADDTGPVVVLAPAKLTTRLRVTGVRDDGYHLIDAEMTTLDLADTLFITPAVETSLTVRETATGLAVPAGPDNLVLRALAAAGRTAAVRLDKRIPAGAGLGGGSADAAAILRWAGVDDLGLAARLGADVAFCVVGGRAHVEGIGEIVTPLPPEDHTVTLLTPPFGVSTPAVYRAWDELGGPAHERNDLTAAALAVHPELSRWRDHLGAMTGAEPVLAGSGGTWFVDGAHEVELDGITSVIARTR
ncbi:MAG: 4-(cytidine 5'-diphospho)-2-C-methyl-D-erythritol kinase [Actinomycetota bacterium]